MKKARLQRTTRTHLAPPPAATTISDLPEPLLLRIFLSALPYTTIAELCTINKRLYSAWNSIPHLNFQQFFHRDLKTFANYVRYTIRRRPRGIQLETLRLRFTEAENSVCREAVDYAVAHGVVELHVSLAAAGGLPRVYPSRCHEFPVSLVGAHQTVRVLDLHGFRWEYGAVLTIGWAVLETARMGCCTGIEKLKVVSCCRLKRVSLWKCDGLKSVWFDTASYSGLKYAGVTVCGEARIEYEGGTGPAAGQVEVRVSSDWEPISSEIN